MPSSLSLDVVVCTKDRPEELRRCLRSLSHQTDPADRLIVVSGGTEDVHVSPNLVTAFVRTSPGLTAQRNAGLSLVDADLVGFFDDDVILDPEYVATVRAWMLDHPDSVGVTGNIVNDRRRAYATRAFRSLFALSNGDGRVLASGDAMHLQHPTEPARVQVLSGSNMVFRVAALDGLLFDEELRGYGYMEDVDFSLRVSLRGPLWSLPAARLRHETTATARIPPSGFVEQVFVNGAYLYGKHARTFGFRKLAFARRLAGRTAAYLVLSIVRRSPAPALGVVRGLPRVPLMVRRGRECGNG